MEDYKELSREQVRAITRGISLGRTLQEDHPEIAVMYGYYSQRDITKMLDTQSEYGVSDEVAHTGVRYAINGHEESFGIEGYVGLITDEEEREWLGREHNVQNGQRGGLKLFEQRKGIHGRTAEQMSKDGREAGLIGGQTTYEQGIGVHGRTAKQMSEDALKSTIARGRTPWTDEEKEFAYMLSQEQEYQRGSLVNNELIALELNIQYHDYKEVRSASAVKKQLSQYRKSLDDIVV